MSNNNSGNNNGTLVRLQCLKCFASNNFNGLLRGNSVTCTSLRQHINQNPACRRFYINGHSKVGRRIGTTNIDLRSSIINDDSSTSSAESLPSSMKRKSPGDPSPSIQPPTKKSHLLSNLKAEFTQKHFGTLPIANILKKGQSFGHKDTFSSQTNWKAPTTKQLDELLFHGGEFFSHFTSKAIILDVKGEHVIIGGGDYSALAHEEESESESESESDSDKEEEEEHVDYEYGSENEGGTEDGNDGSAPQGLNEPAPALPVHNNQQTVNNVIPPPPPPPADVLVQNFRLLERLEQERKDCLIRPYLKPDPMLVSHLKLLELQKKHSFPISAVSDIQKWAHESYKSYAPIFDSNPANRNKQLNMIRKSLGITVNDGFKEIAIDWLPENKKRGVQVRTFEDALYDLLTNPELWPEHGSCINLPHPENPFLPSPSLPTHSSQLHHGWWWNETMKQRCNPAKREILIPLIGYMDGVATDKNSRFPVTPFNITLGIFDVETRKKPAAWTTILLYPDDNSEASLQKGTEPIHKIQNLHNCIALAFRDLKELMDSGRTVSWKLPYNGEVWDVELKFAFAYIIGDTEMHDKLCGRYGPRTKLIKSICRHCTCPTQELAVGGDTFESHEMYTPASLDPDHPAHDDAYFQSISHHPIQNAFHELDFGANEYNIHLATPGELLHMLQKGAITRLVEGLHHLWRNPDIEQDNVKVKTNKKNSNILLEQLDRLGKIYGAHLQRQSDRDKPRTKFRDSLFKKCKVRSTPLTFYLHLLHITHP